MKKLSVLLATILLAILVIGCSNEESESVETNADNDNNEESSFPEEDISVVVPFSPGGAGDISMRIMADLAPDYLNGNNIVVDNIEGGGGVKGQTAAANAEPDGYTLL